MARKHKVCKQCNKEQDITHFRLRSQIRNGKKYYYRNMPCRNCERENASEYHNAWKDDDYFKAKNRERIKEYNRENREKVLESQKERRKELSYIEWRKNYIVRKLV